MIAAFVLRALVCLFDLGHCARIVTTPHGHRCAEVRLVSACPIDPPGFHIVLGGPVCTHDCPDGTPTN